jgi:signal transduction histidine kinase
VDQGYCDLLWLGNGLAPDAQRELVERVQRAAALMLHVLEDTLDYSRLESETLQPHFSDLDLGALAREAVESYRALAERKQIQLLFSCCEELPRLRLDATNMEQILGNLLSNAIKYSDAGSRVELTLQRRGAHVVLSVADHGQGICEAELPLLFRPFQTTSARPTAGELSTGLGLAIVHKLVEANGGEVSVSSMLHQGSTFSVKLPVPGASPELRRPRGASARGVNTSSRFTRGQS